MPRGRASSFKGAVHLENMGVVDAVAFDKTGTLTVGRPALTDLVPLSEIGADDLLALTAAVERRSEHPLAKLSCRRRRRGACRCARRTIWKPSSGVA